MKKFLSVFLSLVLVFAFAMPVSAWSSGGVDHTHQYLVGQALQILRNDHRTAAADLLDTYRTTLLQYADWPDKYENDGGLYTSHFYNPYTGKSFLGSTTALTRFTTHASNAKKYYAKNKGLAMQELGKALHYLADINEPHHAANLIAGLSNHTTYENWVDADETPFGSATSTLYGAIPYDAKRNYAAYCTELFRKAAFFAYAWSDEAGSSNTILWTDSAGATMDYAQQSMAAFLDNFLYAVGAVKAP